MASRSRPNILITGTPGTGKTLNAERIAAATGLRHVNVGELAKREHCYEEYDAEYDTHVLDEDKLLDLMEPMMAEGGCVADYHSSELFPERWFDLVLVTRADNTTLYDRLVARGYTSRKLEENLECEIMQITLEEATESYAPEIVHEVQSVTPADIEQNVARVAQWLEMWTNDQAAGRGRSAVDSAASESRPEESKKGRKRSRDG